MVLCQLVVTDRSWRVRRVVLPLALCRPIAQTVGVTASGLRVRLLGGLDIEGVDLADLGSRKARRLVKRLAVARGQVVSTDAIIDALWPDGDAPARPGDQVSVLVSRARALLGPSCVVRRDAGYALDVGWLDVAALSDLVAEAERRLADGAYAAALAASDAARTLARGALLPDEPDADWLAAERAFAARLSARAVLLTAQAALAAGRAADAAEAARRALDTDAYDEQALGLLMRANAECGRPAVGLAAYAEMVERLRDDLGVDPSPATQAVHLELLQVGDPASSASYRARRTTRPGGRVTLPGREDVLSKLDDALARAGSGCGALVVIEGEPGIGKTRVLDTFLSAVTDGADVMRATADRTGVLPLEPVLDALGSYLATSSPEDRHAALGSDADLLAPLLLPGMTATAAYRDMLADYEPGNPGALAALHVALLAAISRLADRRPVVLAIDDLHHADPSTSAWLGLVARRAHSVRLLVVAARRPDARPAPTGAEHIELTPLDRAAASEVVGARRVDELFERSGGNPLFLVELARAVSSDLPESIRQAVSSWLDDAGDAATTLRCAAELGSHVDVDLLSSVLDYPPTELLNHLEEGQRRELLVDASTGFAFRHEILREALAADTPTARRAWLHREAARVLAARPQWEPLNVAHHARLGGDAVLAARALCRAAEVAGARFDHDEALRLAQESLDLNESAAGFLVAGHSMLFLRRYADARKAADRARGLGAAADALLLDASAAYYARDLDAVLRLADQASEATTDRDVLAHCQVLAAKAEHTIGQLAAVKRRLDGPIAEWEGLRATPFLRIWRGFVHLQRGDLELAAADLADADLARSAPILYAPIYVGQFTAQLAGLAGRPLEAIAIAERMREEVQSQHALRFIGRAEVYRGWALSLLCAPEAADVLEHARAVASEAANREPLGQGTLDLACLRIDRGELDAAAELLGEAGSVTGTGHEVSNAWRIDLRRRYLEGRLALAAGDPATARRHAAEVRASATPEAMTRYVVLADLLDLEAAVRLGEAVDLERLMRLLSEAERSARPEAWRITARLATGLDDPMLRRRCTDQVTALVAHSGPHGDNVRTAADRMLR
jgi:DNA-binding SARP family transcriptional activator